MYRHVTKLSTAAAIAAAMCLAWAGLLLVLGGFDLHVGRVRIRSTDPLRPLLWCLAALAVHIATGGPRVYRRWSRLLSRTRLLALILAVLTVTVGVVRSTTTAGGADAYGYVSQADLWLGGQLRIPQPWVAQAPWPNRGWTVSPLGYRPFGSDDSDTIVPTYSPGLPLLMAGAKRFFGHEAVFWVVPLSAGMLILSIYALGYRLNSPGTGLTAAWLTATSPPFIYTLILPWSDIPATAAWTVAFYWLFGNSVASSAAAGVAAAAAILIRPNFVWAVAVFSLWPLLRYWNGETRLSAALREALAFLCTAGAGILATAVIYQSLYGSPTTSGYGSFRANFELSRIRANIGTYSAWLWQTRAIAVAVGIAAIFVPLRRFWPQLTRRLPLFPLALFTGITWLMYLSYLIFEDWSFLRFLLPAYPLMMLGAGSIALSFMRTRRRMLVVAGLLLAIGLFAQFRVAAKSGTFGLTHSERRYAVAGQLAARMIGSNAILLSMGHSGSARYYTGRTTLRYDALESDWLDRTLEWLTERDVHPYLLIEAAELEVFRRRFAGQQGIRPTYGNPLLRYDYFGQVLLYDLSGPYSGPTQVHGGPVALERSIPPATPMVLRLKEPRLGSRPRQSSLPSAASTLAR